MDSQDQRKTHTPGHESHGVHACHKCGWPFPNPHPSAKHRRAHKKICGTIEGYNLCPSEGQTRSNGSDDEQVSDDDHKSPGPKALDIGNNEKGDNGIGEKLNRSEDEVFSDAVADFSDSGLSQGVKERLQEGSLDLGNSVERVDKNDPKFSGSSENNDFNDADVSQVTVESREDCQIQHPKILRGERVEAGNTLELQDQLSGSTVDPLSNSVADLRAEESTVVRSDDMPDVLPENKIYAGENVTNSSLTSSALETNLKGKDEIKSDRDEVEIVVPSDTIVDGTCEGESKIAVSDAVYSDHQVAEGAVNLKEKESAEFLSVLAQDDPPLGSNSVVTTNASTNDVQEESAHVIHSANSSDVKNLQEKEEENINANIHPRHDDGTDVPHPQSEYEEFKDHEGVVSQNPSRLHPSESLKHEEDDLKEIVKKENNFLFNPSQLTEKGDGLSSDMHVMDISGSMNKQLVNSEPMAEGILTEEHTEDSPVNLTVESSQRSDEIGVPINAIESEMNESHMVHFSEEQGPVDVENSSQLTEKSDGLSSDMHVMDSYGCMNEVLVNTEPMAEEMHTEEHTEVSPVKLTVESSQRSDEIGGSINVMESEMNESQMVHFSEAQGPVDVENSQQISLSESNLMASSNANLRDASFVAVTSETGVISIDNTSHHEKNRTEINDVAVDGKDVANLENDLGTQTNDIQPGDLLQLEVKQSIDLFKTDDAGEMNKIEKFDIANAQCRETASNQIECPVISDAVIDEPTGNSTGIECTNIGPLSGAQEVAKEDEINGNVKVHEECNRSVGTSADLHQARDAELLVNAAEDFAGKHTSPSSLNAEPSAQHYFAVKDDQDAHPCREVSGITAVPVQGQSGNNLVKHCLSGIDASVYSSSRCDSLDANWGSVSVLSMQSDAPALIDAETSPSTGLAPTEAGKSNLNNAKAASERQQSGKSKMFEAPSFMILAEPGHAVSHKAPASEGQKGKNPQQPSSTSQAGWFPPPTQVTNESQGRNKNEEIIAKVTSWSTSKEHTPLKSLLGEAAHSDKPTSPKLEENSVKQKNGKLPESNGSGFTTVNSILGPESPAAQAVIGDAAKEWNSPARYPADMKREKRKVKSRPYWIQLVCCSSVDLQRR